MATEALSGIFAFAGWAFLPNYATTGLQSLYYNLTIRAGTAHPLPGSPLWQQHRRRIHILVLCLYLLYTLVQNLHDTRNAGDFYTLLAVTPSTPDRAIKARFRRLAAQFHPDKVGPSAAAESAFVKLKLAQDTLLDPAKRFAYDRFGPKVVEIHHPGLRTIKDYVYVGLRSLAPEYVTGAAVLVGLNAFYLPRWGVFWRYFAIASLAFLELYLLTHEPQFPQWIVWIASLGPELFPRLLPPHLLPFQILGLARRLSLSLNIFISQLAPPDARKSPADLDRQFAAQVNLLAQTAARVDAEANGALQLGMAPFRGDAEQVQRLRRGMKEGMVLGAVRGTPEVREAVGRVLERRGVSGTGARL